MSGMFAQLKAAAKQGASKLGEMVGIDQHAQEGVDPLDEARARVAALRSSMDGMKGTLLVYSRHLLQWAQATSQVSSEWGGLYSASATRAQSLHTFNVQQSRIERCAFSLYKDTYGWDVLSVFDEWEAESARITADIDKTAKAREQVANMEDKVKSLRAAKEKRAKRAVVGGGVSSHEGADRKEDAMLESHQAMLDKYTVLLSNMRLGLDKNLNQFFESRFQVLDRAFVRFMEIQVQFFREGAQASQAYQQIIDNYRKRFPRTKSAAQGAGAGVEGGNQYGPTPDVLSPLPATNGHGREDSSDLLNLAGHSAAPPRSQSTPPQREEMGKGYAAQRPVQHQQSPPVQRRAPPPAAAPATPADDSSDSDTDTDSDTHTDSSDDEAPSPRKPAAAAPAPAASRSPEPPVMDLFDFPSPDAPVTRAKSGDAPAAAAAPAHKANKPSAAAESDLSDFFGQSVAKTSPSASQSASSSSSKPLPPKHSASAASASSTSEFDFDFLGGGASAAPHVSSSSSSGNLAAPARKLPQSESSPALHSKKHNDLLSFDPFAAASPQAKPAASTSSFPSSSSASSASSSHSHSHSGSSGSGSGSTARVRSSSPPPAPPGTSTSGMVNAYIPPTHRLDEHIAEQQARKVSEMRAAEEAEESALEARREAEGGLESMLSAWENNKDGTRKNIRNLLSSVHTVLWPNSGWKACSFADLIDFAAIKKAHMRVIRVVHPDRLTDATPEQLVIALRVFDVLNTAFDKFKETGQ